MSFPSQPLEVSFKLDQETAELLKSVLSSLKDLKRFLDNFPKQPRAERLEFVEGALENLGCDVASVQKRVADLEHSLSKGPSWRRIVSIEKLLKDIRRIDETLSRTDYDILNHHYRITRGEKRLADIEIHIASHAKRLTDVENVSNALAERVAKLENI